MNFKASLSGSGMVLPSNDVGEGLILLSEFRAVRTKIIPLSLRLLFTGLVNSKKALIVLV